MDCASRSVWGEQSLSVWEAISGRAGLPREAAVLRLLCPRRAAEASAAPGTSPAALGAGSRILHAQLSPLISLMVRRQKNGFRSSPVSSGAAPHRVCMCVTCWHVHLLSQCGALPGDCVVLGCCSAYTRVETNKYSLPSAEVTRRCGGGRFLT